MSEVLQNKSENQKHTLLRSFLNEGTDKEVHEHMKMLAKGTPERELVDDLKRPGVSCFSDNNDNILMWAHYAESFKGYCLEFRTDNDFFDTVEHVKYVKDFMAVDLVPLLLEEAVSTEAIFLTKSFHWDSESEWRLLSNQQRVSFNYDKDILTAVYFGPRMEKALIEIIYLILEATNSDVKYWLGKLNKGEYRVDFEEYKFPDY